MYPKPYTTHALPLEHMHPKPYTTHAWTTEHMHPKPYACPISGGLGHLLPALTPSCDPRACPISGCHATAGHTWVMLLQDIGESRYRRTSGITVPSYIRNHCTAVHWESLYRVHRESLYHRASGITLPSYIGYHCTAVKRGVQALWTHGLICWL